MSEETFMRILPSMGWAGIPRLHCQWGSYSCHFERHHTKDQWDIQPWSKSCYAFQLELSLQCFRGFLSQLPFEVCTRSRVMWYRSVVYSSFTPLRRGFPNRMGYPMVMSFPHTCRTASVFLHAISARINVTTHIWWEAVPLCTGGRWRCVRKPHLSMWLVTLFAS